LRENRVYVKETPWLFKDVAHVAGLHLKILDPELGDEELGSRTG
jgi:hypothetical protein